MAKRLYVGGLPYSVDDNSLGSMFATYGTVVSANVIIDRSTSRSKGFGFVEMAEFADVAVAFSLLNKSELDGRRIEIEPHPALRNGKGRKTAVAG